MRTLIIAAAIVVITAAQAQAAEIEGSVSDWIKSALGLIISHEAGHANAGAVLAPGRFEFTGSGLGLGYDIKRSYQPVAPDAAQYAGATTSDSGQIYLPPDSLKKWQLDYSRYSAENKNWITAVLRNEAAVAGAGFVAQQQYVEQLQGAEKRRALILSAALKTGYVAYHFADNSNSGDIERTSWSVPVALPVAALVISAASDIYRSTQNKIPWWSIGYFAGGRSGAVGLSISGVF